MKKCHPYSGWTYSLTWNPNHGIVEEVGDGGDGDLESVHGDGDDGAGPLVHLWLVSWGCGAAGGELLPSAV